MMQHKFKHFLIILTHL